MSSESESKSEPKQRFEQFGGVTELNLIIRIPTSFYEAVKEYCKIGNTSTREFFNHEIIDTISNLEIGDLRTEFTRKYHLESLSPEDRAAVINTHISYNLQEEKLGSDV